MSEMGRNGLDLPPVWAVGIGTVAVAVSQLPPLGPFVDEFYGHLGLYVMIAGAIYAAYAAALFQHHKTPIEPRARPERLIAEGPFRINRNPIYSGMILIVFGANFAFGGPVGVAVCALFPLILTRRFVVEEEQVLLERFGGEAERYLATTRRW